MTSDQEPPTPDDIAVPATGPWTVRLVRLPTAAAVEMRLSPANENLPSEPGSDVSA